MKKKFNVEGMTCASCQAHVQKSVDGLDGVYSCNVNLLKNTMDVEFDENKCSVEGICSAVEKGGYKAYLPEEIKKDEKKKDHSLTELIVASCFLLALMYFSMGNMMWGWPSPAVFDMKENPMGFALIQFILVLPVIYIYRRYFINGFKRLFKLSPNMDSLIAVGSSFSLAYGIYALFMISWGQATMNSEIIENYHMSLYFESAGMILVFVSIGKYLEKLSKKKTTSALEKLMDLAPKKAVLLLEGKEKEVRIEEVKKDDLIIIKKGESVPVDGIITEGKASFDESNLTGESLPKLKRVGDEVFASSILSSGYVIVRATKVGEDSSINVVIKLVEEASSSKAPISRLADKISGIFVPLIFAVAILVFTGNFIYINVASPSYVKDAFETSLNFALTVIVIACPCALGLATPVAIMVGSGKGAQNGLLIRNAEILERAHNIKTVVLDKTGTITEGKPEVTDVIVYDKAEDISSLIYALENKSEHPLASTLTAYSSLNKKKDYTIENYLQEDGKGVSGTIEGFSYKLGNISFLDDKSVTEKDYLRLSKEGKTTLVLIKEDKPVALIALKDKVKESSYQAVQELKKNNIKVLMLTGDNKDVASYIASEVGVDEVIAEVFPSDKAKIIKSLKTNDRNLTAMVGDGVNDALALTSADLGISLGGGSDIAKESSDIVLLRNDLMDVPNVIKLSRRIINTIKAGLFWAFFYNFICVILASGIFYYLSNGSFKMVPMYGSIAMSVSSVSVVLNALTINLFKVKRNQDVIETDVPEERKEEKQMDKEVIIPVEGMMCMHCVKHVQDACMKVNGVKSAIASLDDKNVKVTYQGEVNVDDIRANITEAGYEVK